MRLILKYLFVLMGLFGCSVNQIQGQSHKYFSIKGNLNLGFSKPLKNPTQFPIGFTDATLIPEKQFSNIGYQYSLAGLYPLTKMLSIGITAYVSDFSFTERGELLNSWTNLYTPYSIDRSFKMYGIGIMAGYVILNNKIEKLEVYAGANYTEFIETVNIFLWRETDNRTKFLASFSMEYGRLLMDSLYLVCGVSSSVGLYDFYNNISYNPLTYSVTIGLEKKIKIY